MDERTLPVDRAGRVVCERVSVEPQFCVVLRHDGGASALRKPRPRPPIEVDPRTCRVCAAAGGCEER